MTSWKSLVRTGLSHQNLSAKIGPPGPILAAKKYTLPKIVPQGGPNLANMLAKISPSSKTESLYPAHACALIMYTRLSSSYS